MDNVDPKNLPPKNNALLVGMTGCGKTFLVELLFSKVLKLPTLIADATSFTEAGYVGNDIEFLYTRLIQVAKKDIELASLGIICLDEFDKLAGVGSATRFSGEGTNKDLKLGVQNQLLKLMETSEVFVPLEMSHSCNVKRINFPTTHIPFICSGAFSGFWRILKKRNASIGFGSDSNNAPTDLKEEIKKASHFETYGILPELYGRFSSVVVFDELTPDELKTILHRNTVQQYEKELALNGLELTVDSDVYAYIVKQCLQRKTGARGLQTALVSHLEDALFEAYSVPSTKGVRLFVDGGKIQGEVVKRRIKRTAGNEDRAMA